MAKNVNFHLQITNINGTLTSVLQMDEEIHCFDICNNGMREKNLRTETNANNKNYQ